MCSLLRPDSSVGRAPPWFGVVPGSNPGQVIHRKERKQAIIAKLESVTPHTTPGAIESMKVAKIDLQFCWHCQIDSEVPSSKDMPRLKAEKVVVLKKAVKRYWHGETVLGESTSKAD